MILAPVKCKQECGKCHGVCLNLGGFDEEHTIVCYDDKACDSCLYRFRCYTDEVEYFRLGWENV